jgi:hypothetical protein
MASFLLVLVIGVFGSVAANADVNTFTLIQPLNHATVRENVQVRVPRAILNQAAYATISIDGKFQAAPAVPQSSTILYQWDTKNSSGASGQAAVADGSHTIQVTLYDKDSAEIAQATSSVHVANQISSLPDGVKLYYKWRPNELLDYKVTDTLTRTDQGQPVSYGAPNDAASSESTTTQVESANFTFERGVEDIDSDGILLRDHILNDGMLYGSAAQTASMMGGFGGQDSGGASGVAIQSAYSLASKYWTVDKIGDMLADNKPIASGDHFGFPILQLPSHRVNRGDSWETDIMASIQFSSEHMTVLHGQARLDGFEWQSGYPTAKIVETYRGAAKFHVGSDAQGIAPVEAGDVDLKRTVWFAYEAGLVVKSITTMKIDAQMTSDQLAAIGNSGGAVGGFGPGQIPEGQGPEGPMQQGAGGPSGPGMPPAMIAQMMRAGAGGRMPMPPFGGVPGGPGAGNNPLVQQNQAQTQLSGIKLESDDTTYLSNIGSS